MTNAMRNDDEWEACRCTFKIKLEAVASTSQTRDMKVRQDRNRRKFGRATRPCGHVGRRSARPVTYGTIHLWRASAGRQSGALLITRTALGIFYAGDAAVILFFTLSGFVLALPFLSYRQPTYSDFVIRRVCRIYFPYAAALSLPLVREA